jgi:DNA-binding response OmpR family regulator
MRKTESDPFPNSVNTKQTNFPTVPLKEVPISNATADSHSYRPVVLVVDDESTIADTLSEILTRSGYAAIAAYDAESALETALLMPPELLITDVVLPEMSGIELAITVKRVFPDCKIILFSGQASTSDLLASANRDGHHFSLLSKPVHPRDLLARVTETFKTRPQQAAMSA